MKYCVTIMRFGCVFVEAENENDALYIADHQTTDTVCWSEDWEAVSTEEDADFIGEYITEPAF